MKRRDDRRRPSREDDGEDDAPSRNRTLSRNASTREVSWRESEAETMLESAIDAFERRASRSQEKTARALSEVAQLIEASQSRSVREGETLRSISERLADIERRVSRRSDEETYKPIRGALSRLETRLENLSTRTGPEADQAGLRDIDAKLSEIAEQLDRKSSARNGSEQSERLARIETQIAALAGKLETVARAPVTPPAPEPQVAAPVQAYVQPRRPLVDAVAQIAERQRHLDGDAAYPVAPRRTDARPPFDMRRGPSELETRLSSLIDRLERRAPVDDAEPTSSAPTNNILTGLQGEIARMSEHIEKMREEFAQRAIVPPPAPQHDSAFDELRREISEVSRGLGELAPRASVSALERSVREMADRLEELRLEGARADLTLPVEQLTRELRENLREVDARPAISALEQDMRAIGEKLESLESRGGVDPRTIKAIFDQTREVRDLLSRAAIATAPGERARRDLEELVDKLDSGSQSGVSSADVARIVSEIRSVIAEGTGGEGLRALEKRVEQLSERIDSALAASADTQQIAAFGERLEKLHRAVAQNIVNNRPGAGAETQHLEELVRDLAAKVERAADPAAGREDLVALQSQIERMSRKIDSAGVHDDAIASLERMITDLFAQMNETRNAAFEAAEQAARSAVRDAMAVSSAPGLTVELGREIADLRSIQDASDERTHATLKAVHETLERVVDRLATLEDDLTETRPNRSLQPEIREPAPVVAAMPAEPVAPAFDLPGPAKVTGTSTSVAAALARLKASAAETPKPDSRTETKAEPSRGAPALAEEDVLIEPGAGRGRRPQIDGEGGERNVQAGFIAAARRAHMAAQAAAAAQQVAATRDDEAETTEKATGGALAAVKSAYERRRKPILLTVAAAVSVIGALQVAQIYLEGRRQEPAPVVQPAPSPKIDPGKVSDAAPAAPDVTRKPDSVGSEAPAPSPRAEAPGASAPDAAQPAPAQPSATLAPSPRRVDSPNAQLPTPSRPDATAIDSSPVGAIEKPDGAATLAALESLSARGDAAAQYELAARYADGVLAARDPALAAQLFEKSANKGFGPAQYRLGVIYERGLGVARDPALAKLWYQRAADRGNVRAMHNLAVLMADGGGKPDYAAAAKWFRKAAEFGVRDSQYNLAILYARGLGGPQDLTQSYLWFAAAAAQGDEDAGKKRDEIAARLDAATLARARDLAAGFRPRAADPTANEVTPPPGGWQALQPPPKQDGKPASKPKVSQM